MPEYTDIATFTDKTMQMVIRVADPGDQEQINRAIKVAFFGLAAFSTPEELQAMVDKTQKTIDSVKKEEK